MHRRILNLKRKFRRNKKKVFITTFMFFCCIVGGIVGFSYFFTEGSFGGNGTTKVPSFAPKVNGSYNMSQTIELDKTITNGKNLAPGAIGRFKVDIDFSEVGTDAYYKVYFDRANIPNNIHFYVDENLSKELSLVEGVQLEGNSNKIAEHYIYWTWIYNDTPEGNANDNLYMDKEITLPFSAYVSQKIEGHQILVNDYEKPTGRINLSNSQSGSFNMTFNFSNASSQNYSVYFNKEDMPNGFHLYSDSAYQNEITSLLNIYDGENNNTTKTIYWKLDSGVANNLKLYYIVY